MIFRSPLGALAPMLGVALSALWSFATAFAMGMPMTMISNVLPAFFICVGVADSVHLLSVYRDERASGVDNHPAIVAYVCVGLVFCIVTLQNLMAAMAGHFILCIHVYYIL